MTTILVLVGLLCLMLILRPVKYLRRREERIAIAVIGITADAIALVRIGIGIYGHFYH